MACGGRSVLETIRDCGLFRRISLLGDLSCGDTKTHEVVKRTFELFSYATSGAKVFVVVVWEVLVYVVFGLHQWLKGNAWAVQGTGNDPTIGCLFARRNASYRP